MADIAAQLVLHPTASQAVAVLGTTLGRDKIYRAAQYFSRFYAWYLSSQQGRALDAARWEALKNHLALGRRLLRVGKPLEHVQAAMRALLSSAQSGEKATTVLRQLSYASYLFFDMLAWANAVKFVTLTKENAANATRRAFRFWLFGIVFSLCHGILKANRLASEAKLLRSSSYSEKSIGSESERLTKQAAVRRDQLANRYQFIIDILDVWVPASNLGYVQLNDGVLGIIGVITSLMALRTQWGVVGAKAKAK